MPLPGGFQQEKAIFGELLSDFFRPLFIGDVGGYSAERVTAALGVAQRKLDHNAGVWPSSCNADSRIASASAFSTFRSFRERPPP